jgi:hypothetical protein
MSWIGAVLCALAAWRLRATPLAGTALAVTVANVAVQLGTAVARMRGRQPPRVAVALKHVSAVLGAFFLFVSFAMA